METDIFRPRAWQPSVIRTIARLVGWDVAGPDVFQAMLEAARTHRDRISGLRLSRSAANAPARHSDGSADVGVRDDDWLVVAGADVETRVALRLGRDEEGRPRFLLRTWGRRLPGVHE